MRKIALLIMVIGSLLYGDLKWVEFDDAIEEAKKSDKIVMVMLSREGCPACEYMQDIVFEEGDVVEKLQKDFIAVYIDIHKDFLPSDLSYIGTPTFHFINKNGSKVGRIDGGRNQKDFMEELRLIK